MIGLIPELIGYIINLVIKIIFYLAGMYDTRNPISKAKIMTLKFRLEKVFLADDTYTTSNAVLGIFVCLCFVQLNNFTCKFILKGKNYIVSVSLY